MIIPIKIAVFFKKSISDLGISPDKVVTVVKLQLIAGYDLKAQVATTLL